jgi:hypothetical protein
MKPPMRPINWRKRFKDKDKSKTVLLDTDFAGIKAGTLLFIATPGILANYIYRIPLGQTRSIVRLRNELAYQNNATATCPVTMAIYLRVVAKAAWEDIIDGKFPAEIIPFWRVIEPNSSIAKRLRCDSEWISLQRNSEAKIKI